MNVKINGIENKKSAEKYHTVKKFNIDIIGKYQLNCPRKGKQKEKKKKKGFKLLKQVMKEKRIPLPVGFIRLNARLLQHKKLFNMKCYINRAKSHRIILRDTKVFDKCNTFSWQKTKEDKKKFKELGAEETSLI